MATVDLWLEPSGDTEESGPRDPSSTQAQGQNREPLQQCGHFTSIQLPGLSVTLAMQGGTVEETS